jgi:hypothetical protein
MNRPLKIGNPPFSKGRAHQQPLIAAPCPRQPDGFSFMRSKTTFELLRRKLATLSESYGRARSPYDVDRFLALGPYYFYDRVLDGPPRVAEVERLVRLGIPRYPLVNKGTVDEVISLSETRRSKGLASVPQARLLRDRGHPRPWAVRFTDVASELHHLRRRAKGGT